MYQPQDFLLFVELFLDQVRKNPGLIGAAVALITVWVAVKQLNAWRQEMIGKKRFDAGTDFLRHLFLLQNLIVDLRYPVHRKSELDDLEFFEGHKITQANVDETKERREEPIEERRITLAERRLRADKQVLWKRWNAMMDEYRVLQNLSVEARVLDIEAVQLAIRRVQEFIDKLYRIFELHFAKSWNELELERIAVQQRDQPEQSQQLLELYESRRKHLIDQVGERAARYDVKKEGDWADPDELEKDLDQIVEQTAKAVRAQIPTGR